MIFKCKICGGNLEIQGHSKIITCEYCGTKQTLPELENDKTANLYDRANHFRRNNEYDKAEALYEMILNENSKDAEAYWSIALCKFGVEYVEDPATHQYIPTCNRTQSTPIFADENYKQAIKYADKEEQELYEQEAKKINDIQKGILEISNKEKPFDVFICYKETDENGKRTQDSVIAQELYYQLEKEGLKVFFAKITLESKIGESYEPYIYAALNSAKAMIVLGTKKEYFEATWVKNEWSRYLALIKNGEKKTLIPCFKEMDAYDLPEEFSYLQAQDMNKIGFEQDLIYGIKKLINVKNVQKKVKKEREENPLKVGIITSIIAIIALIGFIFIYNSQNEVNKPVLRKDITNLSGYTFSMTTDEFLEEINKVIEEMDYGIEVRTISTETDFLGIGWFWGENEEVIGIEVYSENNYISGIYCRPYKYGSGEMETLSVPLNLYEEAKRILGSETEEWKELLNKGTLTEKTYNEYYQEVEYDPENFYCGMSRYLYIRRTH